MKKDVLITSHVTPELAERVKRLAAKQDRSQSSVIRVALEAYLPIYEEDPAGSRVSESLRDGPRQPST